MRPYEQLEDAPDQATAELSIEFHSAPATLAGFNQVGSRKYAGTRRVGSAVIRARSHPVNRSRKLAVNTLVFAPARAGIAIALGLGEHEA